MAPDGYAHWRLAGKLNCMTSCYEACRLAGFRWKDRGISRESEHIRRMATGTALSWSSKPLRQRLGSPRPQLPVGVAVARINVSQKQDARVQALGWRTEL